MSDWKLCKFVVKVSEWDWEGRKKGAAGSFTIKTKTNRRLVDFMYH